ncbi:MAG: carboxypeptidase-like regulatory domain-containing protein, partial [Saprospiraceae bacterium]|nr:carboxypeptidase-like regulatory domain-containing protein [Saprospiraceae bacterium]
MQKVMTFLCTAFLLFYTNVLSAQSGTATINGKVIDPEEAPVAFANVIVYSTVDSSLVKVEYTDEEGKFEVVNLPAGSYWLDITYVGLPPYHGEPMELEPGALLEMETIRMTTASNELAEVVVTAERPLLELKGDKMVLNVENSINAAGNNGLDLLRKSPGVVVDNNDNITM